MKKIMLIFAAIGMLVSCEEQSKEQPATEQPAAEQPKEKSEGYPGSLAGTVWRDFYYGEDGYVDHMIVFTDTQATVIVIVVFEKEHYDDVRIAIYKTYEYTYDYPEVVLDQDHGNPIGKIENDVLTIGIYETNDQVLGMTLTKQ